MFDRLTLLLCFLFIGHQCAANYTCYTCQYSENANLIGYECVSAPEDYSIGPSTGRCTAPCHTLRQVTLSTGSVYYMWRGCQPESSPEDGCTSDIYYENCRSSCSEDLCNGEDMSVPTTPPPSPGSSTTPPPTTTTVYVAYNTCYTCQYSENANLVGYECVSAPEDYDIGPSTGQCTTPCHTLRQVTLSTGSVYYMWRGCQPESSPQDGCTSDIYYEHCRWSCSGNLCNGEDMSVSNPATTAELPGTRSCYSCSYSNTVGADDRCLTDPANAAPTSSVRCPPDRACTTFRQWDKGENAVRSFRRGCELQGSDVDSCVEDASFITCNTYCQSEFCNNGDGIPEIHGAPGHAANRK